MHDERFAVSLQVLNRTFLAFKCCLSKAGTNSRKPRSAKTQDVSTRWDSTLYMVESILEHWLHMQQKIISHKPIGNCNENGPGVVPVEEITQSISKETATLSVVIPNISSLLRSWERQDNDQGIHTMKEEIIKQDLQVLKKISYCQ